MVSIADVARTAGVSPSTVSYVLSGKRTISGETAERVQRAIRELNYRPHAGARALASARTNVIGLVVPLRAGQNVPVVMEFVAAVVTRARRHDHDVLLLTQDEGVAGIDRVIASALVDALIVMDVQAKDPRLPVLRRSQLPAVLIGIPERTDGLSAVDLDFASAGALALDHLADRGHRRVGLIGQPREVHERGTGYAERFLSGLRDAANERDVALTPVRCEPSMAGLRASVAELLTADDRITGLVVHNEAVLPALREVLGEHGRRLTVDMSAVAVCPDDMASSHGVEYTNVAIPAEELGATAVEMVMGSTGRRGETRLLAPRLTERETTGLRG